MPSTSQARIACYLTKYGHPGEAAAVALEQMADGTEPGDTVAMEYTPRPEAASIRDFINLMYSDGAGTPGADAVNAIPASWEAAGKTQLYQKVIEPH